MRWPAAALAARGFARLRQSRRVGAAVLAAAACLGLVGAGSAAPAARTAVFTGYGFESCNAPSTAALSAWLASPYRAVGIYIGGVNRTCANTSLTASWVASALSGGWSLIPTYVGLQAPCVTATKSAHFTAADAQSSGLAAAGDAIDKATLIGLPVGSPIYFDMEAYAVNDPACTQAVLAFTSAWVSGLHARGYVAGVYGSAASTARDMRALAGTPSSPDDLWIANWNGNESVFGDPYVSDTLWSNHQRIHQYRGGHTETWDGVTINIDNDYVDGAVVSGSAPVTPPVTPPPPVTQPPITPPPVTPPAPVTPIDPATPTAPVTPDAATPTATPPATLTTPATPSAPFTPPAAPRTTTSAQAGSATTRDGKASVAWAAGALEGDAGVTLGHPVPGVTVPGYGPGGYAVQLEVTAAATLNPVRTFSAPLTLTFTPLSSRLMPVYSTNGRVWNRVPQLLGRRLAPSAETGWARGGDGGFVIRTTVSGTFALVPDRLPPSAPGEVAAHFTQGSLVISWRASTDPNSRVAGYRVTRANAPIASLPGNVHRYRLSGFDRHGPSVYRVIAVDTAGNESRPSKPIVVLPSARPQSVPKQIPAWAPQLVRWQAGLAGPRPQAPRIVPDWYWRWVAWQAAPFHLRGEA